jgi:DNA-binding YbaB/EbfC family protein
MFGDLFGNVEQQQEEMRKKLAEVTVTADAGGGAVTVTANANREILDVKIDKSKLDWEDLEEVQDLLVAAVNNALEKAMVEEQAETQKLISQMLPPGMGGLFGR